MMYPLVRELAVDGIPVTVTCRVLKMTRPLYYRWLARPVTTTELDQAYRANALFDAHQNDPEFGYRYLVDAAAEVGHRMSRRTGWRLCHDNGWRSVIGTRRRSKATPPGPPAHEDRVRRDFSAATANQLWLTDITEHPTGEGILYLCAVKDVFSNRIVGYATSARKNAGLAVAALNIAASRRRTVTGCIVHSDRGSQYVSRNFVDALNRHGFLGSMGQVAAAGDNAAMESFFSLLQNNVLDRQDWATRNQLRVAIITWIERTYHRRRRQDGLNRLTPIQFEATMSHSTPEMT